jgi:uncharacterized protein YndB with AHSA1/START domain
MTIAAEFDVPVERVWRLWADPRQLERWWGPPTHPATVVEYDLTPGGTVSFFVTGPEGERRSGWWRVVDVDAPRRLEFDLGDPDIPTVRLVVRIEARVGGGARMTIETSFPSDEAMEYLLSIGFDEGMSNAVRQIDDALRALP